MLKNICINYFMYCKKSISLRNIVTTTNNRILLKSLLTVSPKAASRIITLFSLLEPPPLGIRISINKRGCNGMSYVMKYIINNDDGHKTVTKDDIIKINDKINIYIDPSAAFIIVGTIMDWTENDMVSEFTFNNPNAKGNCGCGESFNV